jgi:hypothetical protein
MFDGNIFWHQLLVAFMFMFCLLGISECSLGFPLTFDFPSIFMLVIQLGRCLAMIAVVAGHEDGHRRHGRATGLSSTGLGDGCHPGSG